MYIVIDSMVHAGFQFTDVIFTLSNKKSKWKAGPTFRFPIVILHPTPNLYPGWKPRQPLINITAPIHTSFTYLKLNMDEIFLSNFCFSLLKCLILLQNLMTIFLMIILSYRKLFKLKN